MPFRTHVLVVASQTVDSPDLMTALQARSGQGPIHVTILSPVLYSEREAARARLDAACAALREQDIECEGVLGDADPVVAVQELWTPGASTRSWSRRSRAGPRAGCRWTCRTGSRS